MEGCAVCRTVFGSCVGISPLKIVIYFQQLLPLIYRYIYVRCQEADLLADRCNVFGIHYT